MSYEKRSNIAVKKYNRNMIFRFIYNNEKTSKQEIARSLGVSLPTITQNLKMLYEEGLIVESGEFESTGGRKAKAIVCVKTANIAVGLDITKNHISIVLVDLGGIILKNTRISKVFSNSDEYFREVGKYICEFVDDNEFKNSKILGVGISIPGILSLDQDVIIESHVLGIENVKCEKLSKYISYPCIFCNDANAAGKAELWNEENEKSIVYLSLSNSVGGAIFYENKMYLGDNQRSGEFGHMTVIPHGKRCYCGKHGCVDSYCSANILSNSSGGNLSDFFTLLENKNKEQVDLWNDYVEYLAITINNLRTLFDCNVILGGYVGAYMDNYIDELKKIVAEYNIFENDGEYLKVCYYKKEASAVGGALLHIEKFMNQI